MFHIRESGQWIRVIDFKIVRMILCYRNNRWIDPVPPGSKHPFVEPCNTIEIHPQTTECTVTIVLRVTDNLLVGLADAKPHHTNISATLETVVDFNTHSTDDCDQQFVLKSIGSSKWFQLNATKTREKITALLIDESFTVKNFLKNTSGQK